MAVKALDEQGLGSDVGTILDSRGEVTGRFAARYRGDGLPSLHPEAESYRVELDSTERFSASSPEVQGKGPQA
ncbi:MAG: hypothetical protein R2751_17375 [Bacteroidales bacterium]